ncbi:MAG: hypothetical protein Q8O29_17880 [Polaromonas sp.]|uniref:hypothetical protein n=1 Tax=Polaromonas sp. TaxID=1869339 RepID=UPI0027328801|nr:hypothetical protein [Polaromonas sp.]MDP2820105.1 hypothetical protein [Polaromonas sp.]
MNSQTPKFRICFARSKTLAALSILFGAALLALTGLQPALAQATPASVFRDLAGVKAECQRVAKLHVQRRLVGNDDRLEKSLNRALAGLDRLGSHAPDWIKISKQPESAGRVMADMKALRTVAATPAASDGALKAVIDTADRCTADADELLKGIQGAGAGGRAVSLAARTLYLSQRLPRDWLLLHSKEKFPGITAETTTQAREEMNSALQQLA